MFKRIAKLFRQPDVKPVIEPTWDSSRAFGQTMHTHSEPATILRAERLRTEIARLKRNKKRWSHLQAELDSLEGGQ